MSEEQIIQNGVVHIYRYNRTLIHRHGEVSGAHLRDQYILPAVEGLKDGETLLIDFDGLFGCTTAFLEEVFGGMAREVGSRKLLSKLRFKAIQRPALIGKVKKYILEVDGVCEELKDSSMWSRFTMYIRGLL